MHVLDIDKAGFPTNGKRGVNTSVNLLFKSQQGTMIVLQKQM